MEIILASLFLFLNVVYLLTIYVLHNKINTLEFEMFLKEKEVEAFRSPWVVETTEFQKAKMLSELDAQTINMR